MHFHPLLYVGGGKPSNNPNNGWQLATTCFGELKELARHEMKNVEGCWDKCLR